jgi:SnoaL-like domain
MDDARLQQLLDRQEILDCIHRGARGFDRHDAELVASAYHPDAFDDHGPFRGSPQELVEFMIGVDGGGGIHAEMFINHQHFLTNHTAEIDGDVAHTETYYVMLGQLRGERSANIGTNIWWGRYIDKFERRDGRWAITLRRVVMEGSAELGRAAQFGAEAFAMHSFGSWDKTDISYQRPLEPRDAHTASAAD